jgi:uncharacterized membrane protein
MSTLRDARVFGSIGGILLLVGGFVPYGGVILILIGLCLVFLGVKIISGVTRSRRISGNYLNYFIINIIAIFFIASIMITTFGTVGGFSFFTALEHIDTSNPQQLFSYLMPLLSGCFIALIIGWILFILSAVYLKRSYDMIAARTHAENFKITGLVYLIGAITSIVLLGFFIMFIARIFEIISYFNLSDEIQLD